MANTRKYNWEKLQNELDQFYLQGKGRLAEFCKEKKLNYRSAAKKIKVQISVELGKNIEHAKSEAKQETLKQEAVKQGVREALSILKIEEMLDKSIIDSWINSSSDKSKRKFNIDDKDALKFKIDISEKRGELKPRQEGFVEFREGFLKILGITEEEGRNAEIII